MFFRVVTIFVRPKEKQIKAGNLNLAQGDDLVQWVLSLCQIPTMTFIKNFFK